MTHRYYHPYASPYATTLRLMAHHLAERGLNVHVLSTMPTYNQISAELTAPAVELDGSVHVRRLRRPTERKDQPVRRAFNAALYVGAVFLQILRLRPDMVTFSTTPPVALGLAVRAALRLIGRLGQFAYHCQDLYPEAATEGGLSTEKSIVHRVSALLEAGTRRRAGAVVVPSEDMDTAVAGGARRERIHVINNFSLVDGAPPRPNRDDRPPRIVFAGKLGRFQGLDTTARAVEILRERGPGYQLVFLGEGLARHLLEAVEGWDVELLGYRPSDEAFETLQTCDVGLVTLQEGMLRVTYPSKTMTYLAAGCQLVVAANLESDLCRTKTENDIRAVAPPDNAKALADAIEKACAAVGDEPARHAIEVGEALFGRSTVLSAWEGVVDAVLNDARSPA